MPLTATHFKRPRPMKPERILDFMRKLRKNSAQGIKGFELAEVLEALPGWQCADVTEVKSLGPGHERNYGDAVTKKNFREARDHQVARAPKPGEFPPGTKVYQGVSDLTSEGFSWKQAWEIRSVAAPKVTSPAGETWPDKNSHDSIERWNIHSTDSFLRAYAAHIGILRWLREDTSFLADISAKLRLPTFEEERTGKIRTRDNTGTCPACFGGSKEFKFKLEPKAKKGSEKNLPGMTHHGYTQEYGRGAHRGDDCFGQDWPPFELSSEGTVAYIAKMQATKASHEDFLHRLEKDQEESIIYSMGRKSKTATRGDANWKFARESLMGQLHSEISSLTRGIAQCQKLVLKWKKTALPGEV